MSRRHHEPDDSLELLLDPICNMFGTIMFVALIAALLALTRSGVVVSDAVSAMEREQASAVSQMEGRATELERTLSTLPAGEGRELDQAAADRVERALGEVARREVLIERYQDTVKTARENMDDVASQVEPMRTELMRVRDALEAARRSKDRQVRTPLEREVSLFEFTVVVWNDQLFAICDLTTRPRDACEWLRCWNQKHVVPARCTTPVFECSRVNIHIARSIMLREGAGIKIGDIEALRNNPDFIALLKTLDPATDLIGMVVAPDSFDAFAVVKDVFLSAGFNYSVEPCEQQLPVYKDAWIPGNPRGL
ncbi:MAG: hypothetical protein DWI09_12435 [Planctomycetota bacterium]|nr:MAG: hypothetical protein DWI09_12435 [Planctomycetota bacterium]